ncbi:hypothetical protein DPMN_026223 [Dreissena polymorpha]|uniref:Uncharacterized protein n=1 Tax=Dreissena polymorpha TaxID=45954 RepID=A0A9D4LR94_DREPO|nr:hypothetical protein DPMN_026223 [Dreissena polymorpha]
MLGRETTIPLHLAYNIPTHAKFTPPNEWVWLLQEQLETAHAFVRTYTGRGDSSRPKSTQDDPRRPKSTQVNLSQPKSTQVNPSQPKSTQVDPSQPKSTQVTRGI